MEFTIQAMQRLAPPDSHHLNAAIGWLELGCRSDSLAELEKIAPENQRHPDVLEARWVILAEDKQWEAALDIAHKLLLRAPDRASGWLHCAYALRRAPQGGIEKAWQALVPAADKFPREPVIPFNLACYACQMDKLDEARQWFQRALKAGKKDEIKLMALADADLKPLWGEIKKL